MKASSFGWSFAAFAAVASLGCGGDPSIDEVCGGVEPTPLVVDPDDRGTVNLETTSSRLVEFSDAGGAPQGQLQAGFEGNLQVAGFPDGGALTVYGSRAQAITVTGVVLGETVAILGELEDETDEGDGSAFGRRGAGALTDVEWDIPAGRVSWTLAGDDCPSAEDVDAFVVELTGMAASRSSWTLLVAPERRDLTLPRLESCVDTFPAGQFDDASVTVTAIARADADPDLVRQTQFAGPEPDFTASAGCSAAGTIID